MTITEQRKGEIYLNYILRVRGSGNALAIETLANDIRTGDRTDKFGLLLALEH